MEFTKNQKYLAEHQRIINKKTLNKQKKDSRQNRIVAADKVQKMGGSTLGSFRSLSRIDGFHQTGINITHNEPSIGGADPIDEDNPYKDFCEYYKEDSEYPFTTFGDISENHGSRQLATDESRSRISSRTDLEKSRITSSRLVDIRGKRPEKYTFSLGKFPFFTCKNTFSLGKFPFFICKNTFSLGKIKYF
jgi:hypothetical protein